MAISRSQLASQLRKADHVQVINDDHDGMILTAINIPHGERMAVIASVRNNEMAQFRSLKLVMAPGAAYRTTLLQALADMNCRYKIAKFGFDPSDGEVIASVTLAVMDGSLTAKQIDRVVGVFRSVAAIGRQRCERIRDTGRDSDEAGGEAGLALLEEVLSRALAGAAGLPGRAGSPPPPPPAPPTSARPPATGSRAAKTRGLGKWLEDENG